jgi:putative phosphoesterase
VSYIAVLADTHMPKGARRLPQRCIELISAAGSVIHAGDFTSTVVLEEIEALCPRVFAVHGNVDEPALQSALPSTEEITIAGQAPRRSSRRRAGAGPARAPRRALSRSRCRRLRS